MKKMLDDIHEEPTVFEREFVLDEMDFADEPYTVEYDEKENMYVVEGPRIERMLGYTNLDSEKGFQFFQKFLKTSGILEELERLGIEEGDTVRLYNDRGSVTMLAVLNPGEQRKAVHCPRSFLTREHIDGDLARTTFNEYNQACRNQSYFDCAVAIEKL